MAKINLLRSLPKSKRNISSREDLKTDEHVLISRKYGIDYFDGAREYGYGGYKYDGRWKPVAKDIIDHFGLKKGDKVYIEGRIKTRKWTDDKGLDRYSTEIQCTEFTFLTPKDQAGAPAMNQNQPQSQASSSQGNYKKPDMQTEDDDDLPF